MSATIRRLPALAVLVLVLPAAVSGQQVIYQDLRDEKPLLAEFRIFGPDRDNEVKSEAAGLRITLPKTRAVNQPVSIAATFVVTGDFEITGTYELLAADVPTAGYGVGVSLNIATSNDLKTFLEVCRMMRPKKGSVVMAEYWTKGADDWKGPQEPTEVRSGQLRLVREGAIARCQVSEGPGKEFKTIFEKRDFIADDMAHLRFMVTDGGKPGYGVDARLVDLRVRHGRPDAKAGVPGQNPQAEPLTDSSPWFWMTAGICIGIASALVGIVGVLLLFRSRRVVQVASPTVENVTFTCERCGKSLKTKAISAGKKLKCPKCGTTVVVPGRDKVLS